MAGKKDPSIYDDRSNIGSSEELDEYGVWVKSEPQDLSSTMPEMEDLPDFDDEMAGGMDLPSFDDAETPVETADFVPEIEFEEIPEDSDLPDGQNPTEVDKDGFTEVSMNDFLDEEELESINKGIDIGDLDNIPDLPEELPETPKAPENKAPAGVSASELSNQLLMKIAEELSSIKKELSSLKTELSSVRNTQAESQDVHGASGGGFFDEEDDEKIALTGDELDNILNTANFTEESGSGESVEDDFSAFESPDTEVEAETENDLLSGKPDIIGDTETEIPSVEEETIDFDGDLDVVKSAEDFKPEPVEEIIDDFDVSLDLSEDLNGTENDAAEIPVPDDGLGSLREEGFNPMTRVDGDTSYLEEDPLASIPEDEQIDFSGAVIDDPDLSSQITENPIVDPAIENISIDIDMEEPEDHGAGSEDFTVEHEATMEIPVTEEPLIDDFFPISEPGSPPAAEAFETSAVEAPVSEESDNFTIEIPETEELDFTAESPAAEKLDSFAEPPMAEESDSFAEPPVAEEPDSFTEPLVAEGPDSFVAESPADREPVPVSSPEDENGIPSNLKQELKTVLSYMDQLLESLPEDKIEEFAKSEYFDTYKKLFEELGLV
jgi:hypothetical protein